MTLHDVTCDQWCQHLSSVIRSVFSSETNRLHVSTQRQKEVHVEHLQNLQEGPNNAERVRDRVSQCYQVRFNSTTLKITIFFNESGDVVVT